MMITNARKMSLARMETLFKIAELHLPEQHHYYLDKGVHKTVKRWLCEQHVESDGKGKQSDQVREEKLQNGSCHLEGDEYILPNAREYCQHPHELPRRVEDENTCGLPALCGHC